MIFLKRNCFYNITYGKILIIMFYYCTKFVGVINFHNGKENIDIYLINIARATSNNRPMPHFMCLLH